MTLNDWQAKYRCQVNDHPSGAKWVVPQNNEASASLYTLTDYVVSSLQAGTHWLCPKLLGPRT